MVGVGLGWEVFGVDGRCWLRMVGVGKGGGCWLRMGGVW